MEIVIAVAYWGGRGSLVCLGSKSVSMGTWGVALSWAKKCDCEKCESDARQLRESNDEHAGKHSTHEEH
ncbi:unnamed protein product [Danaus chrysippus]|uniref:(African queen) hypothetical protein n=1 Tax=Danaus chrysippus TaxID=151541 RepID=A0A8J2QQ27_9NEOP|nr:unnamed protein product [Danaus chrysippus]